MFAKQRRQSFPYQGHRALNFTVPGGILCVDVQHLVPQLNGRGAVDGRSHDDAPRKGHFFARERCPAENGFEGTGHDLLHGDHGARIALPAKGL